MISRVFKTPSRSSQKSQKIKLANNLFENLVKLKQEKLEYLANLEKEKETNAKITQEVRFQFKIREIQFLLKIHIILRL